jgi:hypothetical protein
VAELSVAALKKLAPGDPFIANFVRRQTVANYLDFLFVLYEDLKELFDRLESNPQHYPDESEDATTQRLVDMLWAMSYGARHDVQAGGHVDLTIERSSKNFRWIGEAKKFRSVTDMREGYLQLATRYRPQANDGAVYGGLIGYLRHLDAAGRVLAWRKHFSGLSVAKSAAVVDCPYRRQLGFHSRHPHAALGIPFFVWHTCVSLSFAPQDKSARGSKKRKVVPAKRPKKAASKRAARR